MPYLTEELARYDGTGGAPAYIAYENKVYGAIGSFLWQRGRHPVLHWTGRDLIGDLERTPYGKDLLGRVPSSASCPNMIGTLNAVAAKAGQHCLFKMV
jgi:predicted heme/steroid binding protein